MTTELELTTAFSLLYAFMNVVRCACICASTLPVNAANFTPASYSCAMGALVLAAAAAAAKQSAAFQHIKVRNVFVLSVIHVIFHC